MGNIMGGGGVLKFLLGTVSMRAHIPNFGV